MISQEDLIDSIHEIGADNEKKVEYLVKAAGDNNNWFDLFTYDQVKHLLSNKYLIDSFDDPMFVVYHPLNINHFYKYGMDFLEDLKERISKDDTLKQKVENQLPFISEMLVLYLCENPMHVENVLFTLKSFRGYKGSVYEMLEQDYQQAWDKTNINEFFAKITSYIVKDDAITGAFVNALTAFAENPNSFWRNVGPIPDKVFKNVSTQLLITEQTKCLPLLASLFEKTKDFSYEIWEKSIVPSMKFASENKIHIEDFINLPGFKNLRNVLDQACSREDGQQKIDKNWEIFGNVFCETEPPIFKNISVKDLLLFGKEVEALKKEQPQFLKEPLVADSPMRDFLSGIRLLQLLRRYGQVGDFLDSNEKPSKHAIEELKKVLDLESPACQQFKSFITTTKQKQAPGR